MVSALPTTSYRLFAGVDIAAKSATAAWLVPSRPVGLPLTFPTRRLYRVPARGADRWYFTSGDPGRDGGYQHLLDGPRHIPGWQGLRGQRHQSASSASLRQSPAQAGEDRRHCPQTLAQLATVLQTDCWSPPPALYHELYQRLSQRDTLVIKHMQCFGNDTHRWAGGRNVHHLLQTPK